MTKQFKAGQQVKCVDGEDAGLINGEVYTVEKVSEGGGVFLVGHANPGTYNGFFSRNRFELVPEQATKFKAGDKVRNVGDLGWMGGGPVVGQVYTVKRAFIGGLGFEYLVLEEFYAAGPQHTRGASGYELAAPQQRFVVTRVYPNGGYGVTHYFATEQEAREHVSTYGDPSGSYKLSRVSDSQTLRVVEETTVTRTVIAA